ncbi:MAG: NADH-quinone oxidoreductase subunit M [Chloroflexi bacterium]|nr:NADH-quinone oxidoreductase subunit M [Chloroflexota bacterium]
MLTATVFLPLVSAVIIVLWIRNPRAVRLIAGATFVADFALSILVFTRYDRSVGGFHLLEQYKWLPGTDVTFQYLLGVDGLSSPLVLLTGLLGLSAFFVSWEIRHRVREYFVWLLVLQTSVMGVFVALDFVLFFILWELELVPMFFLISIWGSGRKEYSAMKFLIFTLLGSAFMLVAILALFFSTGTFDMRQVLTSDLRTLVIPLQVVFAFFFVAFAVKLPIWPLHTWLPDAHTDAPTAVSVMLAGVLLKMGGYGLIRINAAMFPDVAHGAAFFIAVLAVINVLYGAMVTLRQTDLKRLIAYSSISHMGYVLLGISSVGAPGPALSTVGLTGASLQMFTHGTITGLLFVMVGLVYQKAHSRHIPDLGGLASRMPFIATVFVVAGLASLGLPGLSGFVAEVTVLLGTFPVWGVLTALATFGIVLTAGYILLTLRGVLYGPSRERWAHLRDATLVEGVAPVLLAAAIIVIGVYPAVLTQVLRVGASEILALPH